MGQSQPPFSSYFYHYIILLKHHDHCTTPASEQSKGVGILHRCAAPIGGLARTGAQGQGVRQKPPVGAAAHQPRVDMDAP